MKIILALFGIIGSLLLIIIDIAMFALMIALPFLIIYAIYRAVKGLMTHNANLKSQQSQRDNDEWRNR